ncbi:hydroxyacid dehydrogenase [Streptomyces sp. PSKA30]|uniref:hydroxyacid dehydrogenase n=1 Tax=Streptomyces sp. PSKA30 TaxID=2874597 RepID=UPI0021E3B634
MFLPGIFPPDVVDRLGRQVRLDSARPLTRFDTDEALARLTDVEILITGWRCPLIDAEVLDRAPRLRAVIHAAGTVKHHLAPAVFERGIAVSSAAAANAGPVADYTIAAMVLAVKRVFALARDPLTELDEHSPDGIGLHGATVGIVGASCIGRLVIERLLPLGVNVLLTDPYVTPEEARSLGTRLVDLDTLVAAGDIVSIHAPELPETHHMFDGRRLALLRDGAVLINTSRGSLVDTDALTKECAAGRIDAVLDVTDPEPLPAGHPLRSLPNVLLTPHVAGAHGRELRLLGEFAASEVERFLTGQPLAGAVHAADLTRIA